jgi:hypothetical protein
MSVIIFSFLIESIDRLLKKFACKLIESFENRSYLRDNLRKLTLLANSQMTDLFRIKTLKKKNLFILKYLYLFLFGF